MNDELKEAYIKKILEILNGPITDAKIQLEYHRDEVPAIRYDVTEFIIPEGSESE